MPGSKFSFLFLVIVLIFLFLWNSYAEVQAQTNTPTPEPTAVIPAPTPPPSTEEEANATEAAVETMLAAMSPEDRVGQLFIVTFQGSDTTTTSDIAELLYYYRIGGVVLSPRTGDFTNEKGSDTPLQVARLVNRLQGIAYGIPISSSQALSLTSEIDGIPDTLRLMNPGFADLPPPRIPLFIAVEQLGDGLPATALRLGFTPLPSELALGATWDPALTERVGGIVGRELSAVGVNLLLGPNLDLLEQPLSDSVRSLGIYSFGANPYWVSRLGRAYITGVHKGSNGRVATVARHFPGQGGSDRLPNSEVATIQSSQEELERGSYRPFLSVTRPMSRNMSLADDLGITDGLMSSHMHFRNIEGADTERATPFSLDNNQLSTLLDSSFAEWRANGIVVSNELGVPALQRFYEVSAQEFRPRQVAFSAFTAGNDLLFLGDLFWTPARITDTVTAFQQRYHDDAEFATRVDNSVRRILRLKLRLYDDGLPDDNLSEPQAQPPTGVVDATQPLTGSIPFTATQPLTGTESISDGGNISLPPSATTATISSTLTPTVSAADVVSVTNIGSVTDALSITGTTSITDSLAMSQELGLPVTIPLSRVLIQPEDLHVFQPALQAEAQALMRQVASESMTILFPDPSPGESSSDPLPPEPQAGDQLVIFTDSRLLRECADCIAEAAIGPDAIGNIMLRFYGVEGTGQLTQNQVVSLTFADLDKVLEASTALATTEAGAGSGAEPATATPTSPEGDSLATSDGAIGAEAQSDVAGGDSADSIDKITRIEQTIADADWLIFAMLDVDPANYKESDVVKRFLSQRSSQLQNKRIIVLALNAPYFLDVTEISKLTAYLGVLSKTTPFLENSVNVLFGDYRRDGSVPISVPGTRFSNLAERLQPDPDLPLPLTVHLVNSDVITPLVSTESDASTPTVSAGSRIRVQVGPILDRNRHPVPDGVQVSFNLRYSDGDIVLPIDVATTRSGIATSPDIVVDRNGKLNIAATSLNAHTVDPLVLTIEGAPTEASNQPETNGAEETNQGNGENATPGTPEAGSATTTPTTQETVPAAVRGGCVDHAAPCVDWRTFAVAMITMLITSSVLLIAQVRVLPRQDLVRSVLWAFIVGLFAYILYGLGLIPGAEWLHLETYPWGTALVVFIAMLLPILWLQLRLE